MTQFPKVINRIVTKEEYIEEINNLCLENLNMNFNEVIKLVKNKDDRVYGTLIEVKIKMYLSLFPEEDK